MIRTSSRRTGVRGVVAALAVALPGALPLAGAVEPALADGPVAVQPKRVHRPQPRAARMKHPEAGKARRTGKSRRHRPGLGLTTGAPKGPLLPGKVYAWPYAVTNKGGVRSKPVVFSAPLGDALEFVSAGKDCSFRAGTAVCQLGALKPGQTKKGAINAKVSGAARPDRPIGGHATAAAGGAKATKAFPKVKVAEVADLAVTKRAPARVRPGGQVRYEITVRNHGPATARDVVLRDVVRSAVPVETVRSDAACTGSGRGPKAGATSCELGSLASGRQRTVVLVVRVGPRARPGAVLTAPTAVTTATKELNTRNNKTSVRTEVVAPGRVPGAVAPSAPRLHAPVRRRELPATGSNAGLLADLGVALVGGGLVLYRLGRPRRRHS